MSRAEWIEDAAGALRDRMAQMTARLGEPPRKCYLIPADDAALAALDAALALPADAGDVVGRVGHELFGFLSRTDLPDETRVSQGRCFGAARVLADAGLLARPVDRAEIVDIVAHALATRLSEWVRTDALAETVADAILREMGR